MKLDANTSSRGFLLVVICYACFCWAFLFFSSRLLLSYFGRDVCLFLSGFFFCALIGPQLILWECLAHYSSFDFLSVIANCIAIAFHLVFIFKLVLSPILVT